MPACQCAEKHRPLLPSLPKGSNDRPRQWFVTQRNHRHMFPYWSKFSWVQCRVCGAFWKTAAPYVDSLADCEFFHTSEHAPKVEPYAEEKPCQPGT